MNFLKRQVLFSRRENHLSHHEDFFNIVKLVTDEASNQFSPLFSENPLKHSRLKSHLCASTGVCSLLLLITHSDCYTLRVPAICPYYSHIARLRRPFMLIIYNSPQIVTRFAFPQSVLIIRISRDFVALLCS